MKYLIKVLPGLILTGFSGLLWAAADNDIPADQAVVFPTFSAETLSGKELVFPGALKGKARLVVLAFERDAQPQADSWLEPFIRDYGNRSDVDFHEIPMLPWGLRIIRGIIDGGMRGGIPEIKHDHVSTYYGRLDPITEVMSIQDRSAAHAFLIDMDGHVLWRGSGFADTTDLTDLDVQVSALTGRGK